MVPKQLCEAGSRILDSIGTHPNLSSHLCVYLLLLGKAYGERWKLLLLLPLPPLLPLLLLPPLSLLLPLLLRCCCRRCRCCCCQCRAAAAAAGAAPAAAAAAAAGLAMSQQFQFGIVEILH